MTTTKQPSFKIKTGDLAGTYPLRWPFIQADWEFIFKTAGVGMLEFGDEVGRGNPLLLRALLTMALTQAGRVIEPEMLDELDPLTGLDMDWPKPEPETAADGSPLVGTNNSDEPAAANENGSPTGESSGASSDTSPESVTELYSGSPGSDFISTSAPSKSADTDPSS